MEKRLYEGVDEAREASTGVERRGKRLREETKEDGGARRPFPRDSPI